MSVTVKHCSFTNLEDDFMSFEMLSRLDAVSVSERQSFFCMFADSHIVQFGAEASSQQAHSTNTEVLHGPYVGRNLFKSLSWHFFFFHLFYAKQRNC